MSEHVFVRGEHGAPPDQVCAALKAERMRRGLTQDQLVAMIGRTKNFVQSLEGYNPRRPSMVTAERLIGALALEETADGRALAAELRLLAAPNAGRSKRGFYQRSLAEKAAAARQARAKQRELARIAAAEACDMSTMKT